MNKWTVKDFITLTVFNILMFVASFIGSMSSAVLGEFGSPIVTSLLATPFMMILASKVNKRGVFLFSAIFLSIAMAAMGMVYYFIAYLIFGVIAEVVCWKQGSYQNPWKVITGMSIYQIGFILAGVVPLILFRDLYIESLAPMYPTEASLNDMLHFYESPLLVTGMCVTSVIGVLLGGLIGKSILSRHINKEKLV